MGFWKNIFGTIGANAMKNAVNLRTINAVNKINEGIKDRKSKRDEKVLNNIEKLSKLYESGALSEQDYNLKLIEILYSSGTITEREYKKRKKEIIKKFKQNCSNQYIVNNRYKDNDSASTTLITSDCRQNHKQRESNGWLIFFLCLFFGYFGVHKFAERKIGMGILYIFTAGLFCFGWFIDVLVCFKRAIF